MTAASARELRRQVILDAFAFWWPDHGRPPVSIWENSLSHLTPDQLDEAFRLWADRTRDPDNDLDATDPNRPPRPADVAHAHRVATQTQAEAQARARSDAAKARALADIAAHRRRRVDRDAQLAASADAIDAERRHQPAPQLPEEQSA